MHMQCDCMQLCQFNLTVKLCVYSVGVVVYMCVSAYIVLVSSVSVECMVSLRLASVLVRYA